MESLIATAVRELESKNCICGKSKWPGHSFCHACYMKLPKATRLDLYKPLSEGYAEIYDRAKEQLRISG